MEWAAELLWAVTLILSFATEPSGPGARPAERAALARWVVHDEVRCSDSISATIWRVSDSCTQARGKLSLATVAGRNKLLYVDNGEGAGEN